MGRMYFDDLKPDVSLLTIEGIDCIKRSAPAERAIANQPDNVRLEVTMAVLYQLAIPTAGHRPIYTTYILGHAQVRREAAMTRNDALGGRRCLPQQRCQGDSGNPNSAGAQVLSKTKYGRCSRVCTATTMPASCGFSFSRPYCNNLVIRNAKTNLAFSTR